MCMTEARSRSSSIIIIIIGISSSQQKSRVMQKGISWVPFYVLHITVAVRPQVSLHMYDGRYTKHGIQFHNFSLATPHVIHRSFRYGFFYYPSAMRDEEDEDWPIVTSSPIIININGRSKCRYDQWKLKYTLGINTQGAFIKAK